MKRASRSSHVSRCCWPRSSVKWQDEDEDDDDILYAEVEPSAVVLPGHLSCARSRMIWTSRTLLRMRQLEWLGTSKFT